MAWFRSRAWADPLLGSGLPIGRIARSAPLNTKTNRNSQTDRCAEDRFSAGLLAFALFDPIKAAPAGGIGDGPDEALRVH
jgi:hypothetical protein